MPYEDKAMASLGSPPSSKPIVQDSNSSKVITVSSDMEQLQLSGQPSGSVRGPVAIFWDIESCPVPSDVQPEDVAGNIQIALQAHSVFKGAVVKLFAYGDVNAFPQTLMKRLNRTGVTIFHVPNGAKDGTDKTVLALLFALDHRPPSFIMLLSGDILALPLRKLRQRGYTIALAIPSSIIVSSPLSSAGRFVWDWPILARGEGIVPARPLGRGASDLPGFYMGVNMVGCPDVQNEEHLLIAEGGDEEENDISLGAFFEDIRGLRDDECL